MGAESGGADWRSVEVVEIVRARYLLRSRHLSPHILPFPTAPSVSALEPAGRDPETRAMQIAVLLMLCVGASNQLQGDAPGRISEKDLLKSIDRIQRELDRDTAASLAETRALRREGELRGDPDAIAIALSYEAQIVAITDGPIAAERYFTSAEEATPEGSTYPAVALELARFEVASHGGDELQALVSIAVLDELTQNLPPSSLKVAAKFAWSSIIEEGADSALRELRLLSSEAGTSDWIDPWLWCIEHELLWIRGTHRGVEGAPQPKCSRRPSTQMTDGWPRTPTTASPGCTGKTGGNGSPASRAPTRVTISCSRSETTTDRGGALELKACILREAGLYDEAMRTIGLALEAIDGRGFWELQATVHSTGSELAGILGDEVATLEHTRGFSNSATHLTNTEDAALFRRTHADLVRAVHERGEAESRTVSEAQRSRSRIQQLWGPHTPRVPCSDGRRNGCPIRRPTPNGAEERRPSHGDGGCAGSREGASRARGANAPSRTAGGAGAGRWRGSHTTSTTCSSESLATLSSWPPQTTFPRAPRARSTRSWIRPSGPHSCVRNSSPTPATNPSSTGVSTWPHWSARCCPCYVPPSVRERPSNSTSTRLRPGASETRRRSSRSFSTL